MKALQILLMVLFALASFEAAAQRQPVAIINYENVAVAGLGGQPLTAAQVKEAIKSAAAERQWEVTDSGPDRMLATLHVRGKHTAQTEIVYTPATVSLVYKDSVNLKYAPGPDGKGVIHPFYNRWVQDLKESIRLTLATK
jgi:hypothetical protein